VPKRKNASTTHHYTAPPPEDPFPLIATRGKSVKEAEEIVERSAGAIESARAREERDNAQECALIAAAHLRRGESPADVVNQALAWNRTLTARLADEQVHQIVQAVADGRAPVPARPGEPPDDGPSRESVHRLALERAGFRADCWIPPEFVSEWQSTHYPKEPTKEAVSQWRTLLRGAAETAMAAGDNWLGSRIWECLASDEPLLRRIDPSLDEANSPPEPETVGEVIEPERAHAGAAVDASEWLDLNSIAARVHLTKRGMENYQRRKEDHLPYPDRPGGGGRQDLWLWSTIRPWLERNFNMHLPEHFHNPFKVRDGRD
jgi:hypothetical protein